MDSLKFMATSLENLAKNLSLEHFVFTKRAFGEEQELMTRKGVYPYDWVDSLEKFEQTFLPGKREFFSLLHGEDISPEDYEFALQVWKEGKMI